MSKFKDFTKKTIEEIKAWAWFASIFPMVVLSIVFLIWLIEPKHIFDIVMVVGGSIMFTMAAIWWWWALCAIKTLLDHWDGTKDGVQEALNEIKAIKTLVNNLFRKKSDK
jgi:hypothetical protein